MSSPLDLLAAALGWTIFLGVISLSYRFIWRHSRPSLSFRGWGTLQRRYGVERPFPPRSVTSARIGATVYQGTVSVVLGESGVTFQRVFIRPYGRALFIPYDRFRLVAPPQKCGPVLSLPVAGRFEVDGVDLWLGGPHAEGLIARLEGSAAPV